MVIVVVEVAAATPMEVLYVMNCTTEILEE
jgi:hypothetical protein